MPGVLLATVTPDDTASYPQSHLIVFGAVFGGASTFLVTDYAGQLV